ncbi:poly(3-hydroxyalkanoate) depolymerase [Diaphorobacter limosus]|uniref:Poly(3-hydroxyalkanoate) depolymerase n=1 Tax=Diaphorobacter limosus TaxID=3036128 RepID=A0ABZ0IZW8_9BURK|nr:poly(3-hydroxyalkanoate) depolymerase [Diaphorobacter sp. Y-1]WOO31530.1 poly(3-hydroxyalkanoate) depolymerase [Diaphorobacter sp. Y-1]
MMPIDPPLGDMTGKPSVKVKASAHSHAEEQSFETEILEIHGQPLCVGRRTGNGSSPPLLLFNGIGGNIELLGPIARWMPGRELIIFDVPGVGRSPLPVLPYRLRTIASLGAGVLDHYGHQQADVLGVSWGGGAAQQFARSQANRCRRLILCATAPGVLMVPGHPGVILKMATPRRYANKRYAKSISGDIYGGDFRRDPGLADEHFKHVKWQSRLGYYLQLAAMAGWTSLHWLYQLRQPTLVMAGSDDPIVPLTNAQVMAWLIPHSELKVFDCGHLFLLTRAEEACGAITEFLDKP